MPLKRRGSVSERFRVWFSARRTAEKISSGASRGSTPAGVGAGGGAEHVDLRAMLGAGFGESEGSVVECECGDRLALAVPMEAAGNHQVNREPVAVIEADCDALAGARDGGDGAVVERVDGRRDGAEEEGAAEGDALET